jgi:putative membrane protein
VTVLLRLLITAIALWLSVNWVPGIDYSGTAISLLLVALVFALVNAVLKPILTVLTCPLILFTLGLFTLVINALLLLATARVSQSLGLGFTVAGFWPAFWGGLLIGIASTVLTGLLSPERKRDRE